MIIKEKNSFYKFETFSQEVKYSFRIRKINAAFVYAILEGSENLCLYSTKLHSSSHSVIECLTTLEREEEMMFFIESLIQEDLLLSFDF